jgi:hypothetical protein|eukprot:SAG25_NODE_1742_length_2413_cov_3.351340_2_plen_106_part_00
MGLTPPLAEMSGVVGGLTAPVERGDACRHWRGTTVWCFLRSLAQMAKVSCRRAQDGASVGSSCSEGHPGTRINYNHNLASMHPSLNVCLMRTQSDEGGHRLTTLH